MIVRFVFLRRKSSLTEVQFLDHWRNRHAALVMRLPGLKRYVQHAVQQNHKGDQLDGIAELWFDSSEAQQAAYDTDAYAWILADENHFLDPTGITTSTVVQSTAFTDEDAEL